MNGLELLISIVGYVALLLWGVRMVRTGITRSFTGQVRRLIAMGTLSRLRAAGVGLAATMVLQSSTATGLIVSSLVSRELLLLPMALAIMLGADVGTTIAAFIFSIDISWLAPLTLIVGVFTFLTVDEDRGRNLGRIAIGLGLTLLSLRLIAGASEVLRGSAGLTTLLSVLEGQPLMAMGVAAGITWLAHSSLSIVILIMSLASAGIVSLPLALALVVGANIGGCVAPFVDQLGGPAASRRVALGNLVMRGVVGLAVVAGLIPLAHQAISRLGASPGYEVLIAHVGFNLLTALLFLPLVGVVAWLMMRLLPDAPQSEDRSLPRYLDPSVIDSPTEALACATRETLALGDLVAEMLQHSLDVFEKDDNRLLKSIERTDDAVDTLHEAIKLYLMKVSSQGMSTEDSRRFVEILTFITNLEHIGDIIDKNLMELAAKKIRNRYAFSREGLEELRELHGRVVDNMKLAFNVFTLRDVRLARKLLGEKSLLRDAELHSAANHFQRLRQGRLESLETSAIHLDIIRDLKRVNSHLTSVAYPILEAAGELLESRLRKSGQAGAGEPAVPGELARPN